VANYDEMAMLFDIEATVAHPVAEAPTPKKKKYCFY